MKTQWRIHRHPEVTKYLIMLRNQGIEIRAAIARLATEGIPSDARETGKPNQWLFIAAGHYVTVGLFEDEQAIYVTTVESFEDFLKRIP